MLRNEISTLLNIDVETLRFYEARMLISKPARLENGYRFYSNKNIEEIKFLQHCRSLGISLDEIKTLKDLANNAKDCSSANQIINKNLLLIETKIGELHLLQKQLISLSNRCNTNGSSANCGIVKSLVADSTRFTNTKMKSFKY